MFLAIRQGYEPPCTAQALRLALAIVVIDAGPYLTIEIAALASIHEQGSCRVYPSLSKWRCLVSLHA